MPKPPIPRPPTSAVPPGPGRDLLNKIHDLYEQNGMSLATLNRRSQSRDDTTVVLSKQKISDMLHGLPEALSSWAYMDALAVVLTHDRPESTSRQARDEMHQLWVEYINHLGTVGRRTVRQFSPADHFAELSYNQWCLEAQKAGPRPHPYYLQGSFALVANEFDMNTTGRGVFDGYLQQEFRDYVEWSRLRGGIRIFKTQMEVRPTSSIVKGELIPQHSPDTPAAFIAIEAHDRGVVTVFFREETTTATLDEALAWWVHGSAHAAAYVHTRLGSRGPSHVSLLLDSFGLAELRLPHLEMWDDPLPQWTGSSLSGRYSRRGFRGAPLEASRDDQNAASTFAWDWASQAINKIYQTLQPDSEPDQWMNVRNRLFDRYV